MNTETGRTVRFGVIGTGKITEWFLHGAAQDKRFEAVAVCSRSIGRAREFASKHGMQLAFDSPSEMASSPDIDAIYVATPNSEHARISMLCMSHGKHVLCEKPLASNAAEARAMAECARRNGVLLMEAMIATMNPNFDIVRDRIKDLGTIRRYFASYCQYSSRYDNLKRGIVANAFNPAYSTGALMDIGVYTIYPMVALFGRPTRVQASATLLPTDVDGQGSVTFTYPDMEASVIYSKIANSYLPSEIEGESGSLVMDGIHTIRSITYIPRPEAKSGRGEIIERTEIGHPLTMDEYYYETREFIDLILSGKTESCTNSLATSITTLELMDEIRRQTGVIFPADTMSARSVKNCGSGMEPD